jgi:glycosyltransferase involved in cell wall biosynthesis
MDMIIVPCRFNAIVLKNSGVRKPIAVCNPPFNMEIYKKNYEKLNIPLFKNRKIYYNICQLSQKKGIDILLKAYFRAFADIPQEVLLVLKVYLNMINRQNEEPYIVDMINRIKNGLRLPINKWPEIYLITDLISDEEIYRLHKSADAYVCTSRGEGWGIPPFEAMAMGNILISHNWGGLADFVAPHNSVVYQANQSIVFNNPHPDPFLYTGFEDWAEPNDHQLVVALRSVHEALMGRNEKILDSINGMKERAKNDLDGFDVNKAGPYILQKLKELYEYWRLNGFIEINNEEPLNAIKKI